MSKHCDRLLRLIAQQQDAEGHAELKVVQDLYGSGFDEAWLYARHRFYLQSGGQPDSLKLSLGGRLALG
ncbi:hypothetical protein [Phenylobacterium sp.]|jgi:hypothetical protein|uniref:hypothetical protein n=1 Tax=Phenylobacterium sp. TaxID=1871053 RepID=UPI002F3F74A7